MNIGMPTLLETRTLSDCISLCRSLGLDFIELNANFPAFQPDRLDAGLLRATVQAGGPFFTLHADENLNPCDFDARVSAAYRESLRAQLRLAKVIDAPIVNMHLHRGVYITLPDRRVFLYERYGEAYRKDSTPCEGSVRTSSRAARCASASRTRPDGCRMSARQSSTCWKAPALPSRWT